MVPGGVCLDDDTVLEIMLLIPSLRNETELLLKILEATGCTPRGLFSLCVYFTPCANSTLLARLSEAGEEFVNRKPDNKDFPCGCFQLDFQLLYFYKWCVLKETANLGCVGTLDVEQDDSKPIPGASRNPVAARLQ
jgi:hypothetical protein